MLLLHSVQSVYRHWGPPGHRCQPSVPLRPNPHLQTHSMPPFNPILGVSHIPLATAYSKHRFQETLCQAFQIQGSRITRCLQVSGVSRGSFPSRSGTMSSLCGQGRLTQALLHFVPLLPVAPVLQLQHPLLLPRPPMGSYRLSARLIQVRSSPPAKHLMQQGKPLITASS